MAYSKIWIFSNQMCQLYADRSGDPVSISAGSSKDFSFSFGNKTFANTNYIITATPISTNAGAEIYITEKTTSGCNVRVYNRNSSTTITSISVNIMAIGEAYNRGSSS